jgi:hypothetical protein
MNAKEEYVRIKERIDVCVDACPVGGTLPIERFLLLRRIVRLHLASLNTRTLVYISSWLAVLIFAVKMCMLDDIWVSASAASAFMIPSVMFYFGIRTCELFVTEKYDARYGDGKRQ